MPANYGDMECHYVGLVLFDIFLRMLVTGGAAGPDNPSFDPSNLPTVTTASTTWATSGRQAVRNLFGQGAAWLTAVAQPVLQLTTAMHHPPQPFVHPPPGHLPEPPPDHPKHHTMVLEQVGGHQYKERLLISVW